MFYVDIDGKRRRVYKQSDGGFYMYITKRSKKTVKKGVYEADPIPRKVKISANLNALMTQNKKLQAKLDELQGKMEMECLSGFSSVPSGVPSASASPLDVPVVAPYSPVQSDRSVSPIASLSEEERFRELIEERDLLKAQIKEIESQLQKSQTATREKLEEIAQKDEAKKLCDDEIRKLIIQKGEIESRESKLLEDIRELTAKLEQQSGVVIKEVLEGGKSQEDIDKITAEFSTRIQELEEKLRKCNEQCEQKMRNLEVEKDLLLYGCEVRVDNLSKEIKSQKGDIEAQNFELREELDILSRNKDKECDKKLEEIANTLKNKHDQDVEAVTSLCEDNISKLDSEKKELSERFDSMSSDYLEQGNQLTKCQDREEAQNKEFQKLLKDHNEEITALNYKAEEDKEAIRKECNADKASKDKQIIVLKEDKEKCNQTLQDDLAQLTEQHRDIETLLNENGRLSADLEQKDNQLATIVQELEVLQETHDKIAQELSKEVSNNKQLVLFIIELRQLEEAKKSRQITELIEGLAEKLKTT